MRVADWREESSTVVAPLLDAECDWWRSTLRWDLAESWAAVGPARASGDLPGFVVRDDAGAIVAWAFFLRHREVLHVGSLVASTRDATLAVLDAVLDSSDARQASQVISFTRVQAPGVTEALIARGFDVEPYYHLEARVPGEPCWPTGVRRWTPDDLGDTVDLIARAYRRTRELRPFVPDGQSEDWTTYVNGIVAAVGCGRFLDWASVVAPASGVGLAGVILTTAVSKMTAHVAQIAVDPSVQGRGLGRMLMTAASDAVRARGFEHVTLYVAGRNRRAGALYRRLGYHRTASFLTALRRQARSVTSVAAEAAGART